MSAVPPPPPATPPPPPPSATPPPPPPAPALPPSPQGSRPPAGAGADAPMIELAGVSKWFGDVVAVSDITCAIGPGVTALLGPNGAGKSTVMRLAVGLARPSTGAVRVLGVDPRQDPTVFARIGLVPQQEAVFDTLRAHAFVAAGARLLGFSRADAAVAAAEALHTVELDPADTRPIKAYSKGMRQRVKIALGIVADPDVLVLDEPLTGLDPRQRLAMIELVHTLAEPDPASGRRRCVLISSHVLDEVERFGSRVLVVAQGRLAAEGDFRAIRDLMDDRPHRIRIRADRPRPLAAALVERGLAIGVHVEPAPVALGPGAAPATDPAIVVETTDVHAFRRTLLAAAVATDAVVTEIAPLDDDLESVFRYLVERR
jgi:ABC-2 type transport system ATP-binding protein